MLVFTHFHFKLACEILNVFDSLSLYHCLERTCLMNLCPTFLYSLGINNVLLHIFKLKMDEGSFQWLNDMIFIKVGNWCSGEQCGSWSWQKLVSRKNQNVCSHYQNDDRQIVNLHRKKDTDNKNRKYFVEKVSFFVFVSQQYKCIYMYIKIYLAIKLVNIKATCFSLWFWPLVGRDKESMHLALKIISYKCTAK